MCGFAGAFHFGSDAGPVSDRVLGAMRDVMEHRGPDGAGLWVSEDRRVGLGHRRLAIIDLSEAATQPMQNEDGRIRLIFNGEIYNHAPLRKELEALGHRFRTDHSDTEVIVHAFEEWGIDCVHRFRGMFALAIWDGREQELWLVRDRIGIKPLYYTVHGGRLLFGSEIKAILQAPDVAREIDREAFYHYLSFLTTPAPSTLFAGIRKLPGGCWARINREGDLRVERYWDVWDDVEPMLDVGEEEVAEQVLEELRTAVELRKISDVPVGVFLSGGIDSSTNAALFSENGGKVRTFSIGYDTDYPSYQNEFMWARKMAETIGAEHHERRLTYEDVVDIMPFIASHQDEPLADPVCVPVYYVSKLARDNGVVVAQVGEGSDELFWGYSSWKRSLRLQQLSDLAVPRALRKAGLWGLRRMGRETGAEYEWLRRSALGQPVFWGGAEALRETQKDRLVSDELRREIGGMTSWEAIRPIRERFEERAPDTHHLNWMSYLDLNLRLPELLLMRVDKMSMATSLEARVPFLDHEFVRLAMSIPPEMKTKDGELKGVLKRAVRGVIPDDIIDRKKQGFGVPVYDWLFGELGRTIHDEVASFADQTNLLNPGAVDEYFAGPPSAHAWTLYNVALWWKTWF